MQETCFCSFINNFIIQLCFSPPTASHNYGNRARHLERNLASLWEKGRGQKKIRYFLTADVHLWLLAARRQSIFPVNGEPLISLDKKDLQTICPHADVNHISPPTSCLWCRRCVGVQRAVSLHGKLQSHLSSTNWLLQRISSPCTLYSLAS